MPAQNSAFRVSVRLLLLAATPVLFAACTADSNPSPMPTGYRYQNRQFFVPSNGPVQPKVYPGEYAPAAPLTAPALTPTSAETATPMGVPATITAAPVMAPAPGMAPMVTASGAETSGNPTTLAPEAGGPALSATTTTTVTTTTTAAPDAMPVQAGPQWTAAAADLLGKTEHDFGRLQDPVYVREAAPGQTGEAAFRQALNDVLAQRHYKVSADEKTAPFAFDYGVGEKAASGKSRLSLTVLSQAKAIITEKGEYDLSANAPVAAPVTASSAESTVSPGQTASTSTAAASASTSMTTPPPPAALMATGAQQPVIVTGPGSAPPPPSASMAAVSTPAPDAAAGTQPTYVYDGRSTNAPGRTAYEQLEGTNRQIDMTSPDDGTVNR